MSSFVTLGGAVDVTVTAPAQLECSHVLLLLLVALVLLRPTGLMFPISSWVSLRRSCMNSRGPSNLKNASFRILARRKF